MYQPDQDEVQRIQQEQLALLQYEQVTLLINTVVSGKQDSLKVVKPCN